MKRYYTIIAFIFITAVVSFYSGCATAGAADIDQVKFTISASVEWDDDYEPDGVQFIIRPLDSDGFLVKEPCSVNATLWSQQDKNKGKLIQEWTNINITRKNYSDNIGARIYLEYAEYIPLTGEDGILFAEVITSSGKHFTFEQANIRLRYRNLPSVQQQAGCCP